MPAALYSASRGRGPSPGAMSSAPEQALHLYLPQDCDFVWPVSPPPTGSAHKGPVCCLQGCKKGELEDGAHLCPFLAGNTKELRVGAPVNRGAEPD